MLQYELEWVKPEAGKVPYAISLIRERSIAKFSTAVGKRFDFAVLVNNGSFKREHLIEIQGKQHCEISSLGYRVRESDGLKEQHAEMYEILLLVLRDTEVVSLHLDDKLRERIRAFLGIPNPRADGPA
ncbi:MAG TPA: hypothetical protein VHV29_18655 [Terriglobales bacterium]|nr:hypothetical protein [Terriglobales bacterium]